ncbi:MAG TPA: DNRLRE domain-containing protein [Candidatus Sulfotelmatobacter sp.]|nr:DNRLRE domain-containing protein [Candidatus Sulfotelmatobacter sp.]
MMVLAFLLVAFGLASAQEPAHTVSQATLNTLVTGSNADVLVVSGPEHVQDTFLRNGKYWGKWNFGNAQFLQVGVQPSTVYDIYHAVSLIRFDLSGFQYANVESAWLRLYVPRNQTQMVPVPIHVHAVSTANAGWKEGASEAVEEPEAASWNSRDQGQPWAGGSGLSEPGRDYSAEPLATRTAAGLEGEWLEFELPKALVQSWMDDPDANAGLLLRTDDNAGPGQCTDICSSQHWSGKGPQLVIRGKFSTAIVAAGVHSEKHYNPRFQLPPTGPVYERWLNESTERYAVWAKDKSINLTGVQTVFPYMWDVIVRGDIILPKAMLPLSKITEEVPAVVARGDRKQARQIMEDFMKYMMVFDYARDQNWYDSGPTADVLSPLQVAKFFVKEGGDDTGAHAIYSGIDAQSKNGRWDDSSPAAINSQIEAQLDTIKHRLNPTAEQFAAIKMVVTTNMSLEYYHAGELKKSLSLVRQLIAEGNDGEEMLKALRSMFFHHRMFLIHQSLFSMPKYSVLIDNGDILGYAQWFYDVREKQYSRSRIDKQLASATRYMWKPSGYQEAEYAALTGCEWSNEKPGYSGTGYVVFDDKVDGRIEWDIDVKTAGSFRLNIRYLLPANDDKPLKLELNGVQLDTNISFSPAPQDDWATKTVTVNLPSGRSKIQLGTLGEGGPDIDYIDIQPIELAK